MNRSIIPHSLYCLKTKGNVMNNKNMVLAIVLSIAVISANSLVTVSALPDENSKIPMYKVAVNDIIQSYTYQGISKVLDPSKSFEDIEGVNLLIENTDIVAVYSNEGVNGNFIFQYMVELK